jgi:hypothetical protein
MFICMQIRKMRLSLSHLHAKKNKPATGFYACAYRLFYSEFHDGGLSGHVPVKEDE